MIERKKKLYAAFVVSLKGRSSMHLGNMNWSKERPGCRRKIKKYLRENSDTSLEDMIQGHYTDKSGHQSWLYFSDGMRTQAKRMLQEREHPGIFIKGKSFFLDTGDYNFKYQILFSDCDTVTKILHLIDHLRRKKWVTPQMIRSLIKITTTKEQRKEIRSRL